MPLSESLNARPKGPGIFVFGHWLGLGTPIKISCGLQPIALHELVERSYGEEFKLLHPVTPNRISKAMTRGIGNLTSARQVLKRDPLASNDNSSAILSVDITHPAKMDTSNPPNGRLTFEVSLSIASNMVADSYPGTIESG